MQIRDQSKWDSYRENNADGYGKCIIDYAERWADLMETRLNSGSPLSEIAKETSHEADTDGITGFMYGAAVQTLADVWVHGDDLRRWHNIDVQIGSEGESANEDGGVLNPAILTIG